MSLFAKLKHLSRSQRRRTEDEMRAELESLAHMAEPGELGNLTQVSENTRAAWSWIWIEQLFADVKYGFRNLRNSPGFAATAVLSLALGIGANTAIFGLIEALMMRWLPVGNPQELVFVKMAGPFDVHSYPAARTLAKQTDIFSAAAAFSTANFSVGAPGSLRMVPGAWVTGDYYKTLQLAPAAGRLLTPQDDEKGARPVAVISYGYWERQFARNPAAVGQTLLVGAVPVTIVGVSPPGFTGAAVGSATDITVPVAALAQIDSSRGSLLGAGNFWMRVLARPNGPRETIRAKLAARWPQIAEEFTPLEWPPDRRKANLGAKIELVPGGTGWTSLRETYQLPLTVLMGMVTLVLLIACANVAALLLARSTARQHEIAVRLAIGAKRGRIVRQLLTEGAVLAFLGAGLGVGLSWLAQRVFVDRLIAGPLQMSFDLTPNWRVLAFTAMVALGTAILCSLVPALQSTSFGPSAVLKEGERAGRRRSLLLSSLVSMQVAFALLLLIGAGLFVRTLQNLQGADKGFRGEGVLLVDVDARREGHKGAELVVFYKDLLNEIQQIPGVSSASISSFTPLSGGGWSERVALRGDPLPNNENATFVAAGPRYFETMQTPLVSGREFTDFDSGAPNVAIVNEAFVQQYFKGRSPIGQQIVAGLEGVPVELEIVGVAKDVRARSLRIAPRPAVYTSYFQLPHPYTSLEVRVNGSLAAVSSALQSIVERRLPSVPAQVNGLTEQVNRTLLQERTTATLASGFGVLALILASVGLYGLLAYSVSRSTKEIGLRIALGADPRRLVLSFVRGGMWLVAIGVSVGLPAAWAASRWLKTLLFGIEPTDPAANVAAVAILLVTAALAAYFPARRASRVDPMAALRKE